MKKPRCEACGIIEGGKVCREVLSEHDGEMVCSWCESKWKKREEREGREITFYEFTNTEAKKRRDDKILKLKQEGKTIKELATRFHLGRSTIEHILKKT